MCISRLRSTFAHGRCQLCFLPYCSWKHFPKGHLDFVQDAAARMFLLGFRGSPWRGHWLLLQFISKSEQVRSALSFAGTAITVHFSVGPAAKSYQPLLTVISGFRYSDWTITADAWCFPLNILDCLVLPVRFNLTTGIAGGKQFIRNKSVICPLSLFRELSRD